MNSLVTTTLDKPECRHSDTEVIVSTVMPPGQQPDLCTDLCPYCNIELRALQRRLPGIEALGASLVTISPEMPDRTLMTVKSIALTFPVLFEKETRSRANSA